MEQGLRGRHGTETDMGQEKGPGTGFRLGEGRSGMGWGHRSSVGDNEELLCEALDKGPGKRATWKAHPRGCAVSARGAA